ncbi:uncharacterized protein L3040_003568 [Drepanopeziza brunnea f. sp. 'multigermtubi']|uniref:uncharacterized protein n=1 Tax=Drepanopeziza brunnea f. sp. 'multigermtubi' TaxID=698441 RepID=UPI0023A1D672|nr:hypothetical protein L3040_003568 [Drepanopeziza brunnea f. sp. 'multigermtubi']
MNWNVPREEEEEDVVRISPATEVYTGLWTLFAGASLFLALRVYSKFFRRTGLWFDDHVLILSWLVLMTTNIFITIQFATGYVEGDWDDRMHILINVSSCGTLIGQALSKTALGITLIRMSNRTQQSMLWFCIISMNAWMITKVFFQWAPFCGRPKTQVWYRLQGPCIDFDAVSDFRVGGNYYNVIMDFVFALFPWWITWNLDMRRIEKIALCSTMSLGMIIAISTAVRTVWRDGAQFGLDDRYYAWRRGMSNIWYSSEVAGTIIVQCIPVLRPLLRPFIREMKSSLAIKSSMGSKRLDDSEQSNISSRSAPPIELERLPKTSAAPVSPPNPNTNSNSYPDPHADPGLNKEFGSLTPLSPYPARHRSSTRDSRDSEAMAITLQIRSPHSVSRLSFSSEAPPDLGESFAGHHQQQQQQQQQQHHYDHDHDHQYEQYDHSTPTRPSGPLNHENHAWRSNDGRSDLESGPHSPRAWIEPLDFGFGHGHSYSEEGMGLRPTPPPKPR